MRLKKAQQEKIIEWVAEGLATDEINERAAAFDEPFDVSRQQVDYYRKSREVDINELRQAAEYEALNTGLAKTNIRVERLKRLAKMLEDDLFNNDKLWLLQIKGVGSGSIAEIVEYRDFNRSEVDALRGVYDDIAKETGGRVQRQELTGKGGEPLFDIDAWRAERAERLRAIEELDE